MMQADEYIPDGATPSAGSVLCVDDEPNILASLRRLLRGAGFTVHTADSAQAALDLLQTEAVDVVVSDMRMPDMNGAQFLEQVRTRWPQTMRVLLTGQADVASIMDAINSGQIFRYITKPWNDDDIVAQLHLAIAQRKQEYERITKAELVAIRGEELKALNVTLQENVHASREGLALANDRLKNNFVVSLKVFATLIETRRARLAGHSRRVADLARRLATRLGLEPALVQEVFVAGLLHDVGRLAFSDELLDTPVANMNPRQLAQYREHPMRGERLLMPLQDLRGAAASVGAQLELFDGTGFPNKLAGRAILVGARILSIASDYDNLQIGVLATRKLTSPEALALIERLAGKRYDPWVVAAFGALLRGEAESTARVADPGASAIAVLTGSASPPDDIKVSSGALVDGMVLSRDLISPAGLMMLPAAHVIDDRLIRKMLDFEKSDGSALTIHVIKPGEPEADAAIAG